MSQKKELSPSINNLVQAGTLFSSEDLPVKEINAADVASRQDLRDMKVGNWGRQIVSIPWDKIQERPGFNVRVNYGDIESLAKSILNNGQEQPVTVDILKDGTIYLNDGYRRLRAFRWLAENGQEPQLVECLINPKGISEEDRIFKMFVTQDNKQLEPIETAMAFQRLVNLGHKPESIAERIGHSVTSVKNYLLLAKQPQEIKNAVNEGHVNMSVAVELAKTERSENERTRIVKQAIQKGEKINVKDVKAMRGGSPQAVHKQLQILKKLEPDIALDFHIPLARLIGFLEGAVTEEELLQYDVEDSGNTDDTVTAEEHHYHHSHGPHPLEHHE